MTRLKTAARETSIFTDLILHNYRSNQSALMTRFRTDLRHQYGIFGGKTPLGDPLGLNRGQTQKHAQCTRARLPAAKMQNRCYEKRKLNDSD